MPGTRDVQLLARRGSGPQQQTFAKVNRWIGRYARVTRGMVLCDWASALSDPTTGDPIADAMADGTHPAP